jgi:hypothetical protein
MKRLIPFLVAVTAAACSDSPAAPLANQAADQPTDQPTDQPGGSNNTSGGAAGPETKAGHSGGTTEHNGATDTGTAPATPPSSPAPVVPQPASGPATSATKLSSTVTVKSVSIFQAVNIPLAANGKRVAEVDAPIIAGRRGVIRVYVQPTSAAEATTCVLSLQAGGKPLPERRVQKVISKVSADSDLASVFDFDLTPAEVTADLKFAVSLVADTATAKVPPAVSAARYPQDGSLETLGASESSKTIKIVLVPVQYGADSSDRLPDTSPAQLEAYRREMLGLYPVATVDIKVHAPMPYAAPIGATDSNGWSNLLSALTRLRSSDRVASEVYYYGVFSPVATFATFCQRGCIAGLSGLAQSPRDAAVRASIGLGFTGREAAKTMAHELGHAHGRQHAPCGGAAGADPRFPYADATLGVWGFSVNSGQFIDPGASKTPHDMMSYCDPAWISDYQFTALFKRVVAVNTGISAYIENAAQAGGTYRMASVDADGNLNFQGDIQTEMQPVGERKHIKWLGAQSSMQASMEDAHFYPYDHIPGGILLMKKPVGTVGGVEFEGRSFRTQ